MSALTPEVRELLQAVHDALTLPGPAITERDMDAFGNLIQSRAADVRIKLDSLLRHPNLFTLTEAAEQLREWTAETPVTYTVRQDGGQQ
ncbi:hypothetical protein [Actinacidiphila glaucinigra]|uniref:hypothetical protein n=1 Tax=Actinacidiphila glaucinigra TaxID=235986 RepID=UPI003722B23B